MYTLEIPHVNALLILPLPPAIQVEIASKANNLTGVGQTARSRPLASTGDRGQKNKPRRNTGQAPAVRHSKHKPGALTSKKSAQDILSLGHPSDRLNMEWMEGK